MRKGGSSEIIRKAYECVELELSQLNANRIPDSIDLIAGIGQEERRALSARNPILECALTGTTVTRIVMDEVAVADGAVTGNVAIEIALERLPVTNKRSALRRQAEGSRRANRRLLGRIKTGVGSAEAGRCGR